MGANYHVLDAKDNRRSILCASEFDTEVDTEQNGRKDIVLVITRLSLG